MKKWLREPLLHFLLIGSAIFLLYGLKNEGVIDNSHRIVINEANINRLNAVWKKKWQRPATPAELQDLIEQQVREEVMFREALAMGLDQNDSVVRRRLAQKLEFISADLAVQVEPTEDELADYLTSHAKKFEVPGRINFVQVYFNADRRGKRVQQDARRLLSNLLKADPDKNTLAAGDPFMFGQHHQYLTQHGVARLFGSDFAAKLFNLPVGSWQGPVWSAYGLHLVRIGSKTAAHRPELGEVRTKVRNEWFAQQRRAMNKAFYLSLRQRYEIVIKNADVNDVVANLEQ